MTKSITTSKSDVPIAYWAEAFDVGDIIEFHNPITKTVESATIIGFSTLLKNKGLPVVDAAEVLTDPGEIEEIAIEQRDLANGNRTTQ